TADRESEPEHESLPLEPPDPGSNGSHRRAAGAQRRRPRGEPAAGQGSVGVDSSRKAVLIGKYGCFSRIVAFTDGETAELHAAGRVRAGALEREAGERPGVPPGRGTSGAA